MWAKIVVFLISVLCFASSQNSNKRAENGTEFFGYELLVHQMEELQWNVVKMSEVMNAVVKNQNPVDAKMNQLNAGIATLNSSLLNRLTKLESLGETIARDQKATENRIVDITASVSTLNKQSEKMQKYHFGFAIPSCDITKLDGVYRLQVPSINVLCKWTEHDGGWLVIQKRINGNTSFERNWTDYRKGFGTVGTDSEFWLGLEAIHQITSSEPYDLHVEVTNESGEWKYAYYSQFKVAGEDDDYRLTVGGPSGTALDELIVHNNRKFSTKDVDNDESVINCAEGFKSGWWFSKCETSNLNGPYDRGNTGYGIKWGSFTDAGTYSLMMIRPQSKVKLIIKKD